MPWLYLKNQIPVSRAGRQPIAYIFKQRHKKRFKGQRLPLQKAEIINKTINCNL